MDRSTRPLRLTWVAAVVTMLCVVCAFPGAARPEDAARDATLPPAGSSHVKQFTIVAENQTITIEPGVRVPMWAFNGTIPGPTLHVRQGDEVRITFVNKMPQQHSMDFHAATIPWNAWYQPVDPGKSITFTFTPKYPGAFMYHCGTPPAFMHISSGMYGAIIVDPVKPLPPAKEFVLVESEFYVTQGANGAYQPDAQKVLDVRPDYVVFNGAANQYQTHPLTVHAGDLIRLYVVNAGPTLFSAFHVIGWLFDRVYIDGNPANTLVGIQTYQIPPGGGATLELTITQPGLYPFVTHAFAYTGRGAIGVIKVLPTK